MSLRTLKKALIKQGCEFGPCGPDYYKHQQLSILHMDSCWIVLIESKGKYYHTSTCLIGKCEDPLRETTILTRTQKGTLELILELVHQEPEDSWS